MKGIKKMFVVLAIMVLVLLVIFVNGEGLQKTKKIGVIAPLSGDFSFFGDDVVNAISLADTEYEIIYEDDQSCNLNAGINSANKLINVDKVDVLISTCTNLVSPLYDRTKEADVIYVQLLEGLVYEDDHLYQMLPLSSDLFYALGEHSSQYESVCLITEQSDLMQSNAVYFKEGLSDAEGVLSYESNINPGTYDFKSEILKCVDRGGDAVLPLITLGSKVAFLKQFQELDYDIILIGEANDELNLLNYDFDFEDVEYTGFDFSGSVDFKSEYFNKFNQEPGLVSFLAYDAINLVEDFGEDLVFYNGVLGGYSFDENGNSHAKVYLKRIKNNTPTIVREIII